MSYGRSFVGRLRQYAVASLLAYATVQGVHRRFVSIIVPNIGTSIVAFRLICARCSSMCPERADPVWPVLPVLRIPAVFSGQCFLFDYQFEAMHRFMLFLFGRLCALASRCRATPKRRKPRRSMAPRKHQRSRRRTPSTPCDPGQPKISGCTHRVVLGRPIFARLLFLRFEV